MLARRRGPPAQREMHVQIRVSLGPVVSWG